MVWRIFNVTDNKYIEANAIFGPWRDSWDTSEEAAFEMKRLENTMQAVGINKALTLRCPASPPPTRKDRRMSGEESIGDELAFPAAPGSVGRMTYRQWLIGQALAGFCSISGIGGCRAKLAIESADEVLKQLEQERTLPNGP